MFTTPDWFNDAVQERALLALNHLLSRQPHAAQRLLAHAGRVVHVRCTWPDLPGLAGPASRSASRSASEWRVRLTPAGLLEADAAGPDTAPEAADLGVALSLSGPHEWWRAWREGRRPPVRLEGDAALATDVGWVIDHLRWDWSDDIHRLIGPGPAAVAQQAAHALLSLWTRWRPAGSRGASPAGRDASR
jgi:ubiquinone biosynthesis protein UbiJ